ncbi:mersacidin/lichenicidin family type 2 lantibiotic [Mesobacillus foraminis]|uniref:Mersacidin/lichenicidin family type 2 lantibiotic n=1 Tax=Mesobacillus foraminis TaxID=279826 RepID=A0A4R2AXX5_9BACI|nr:mersacidin/lichenicidin family type 2 lantibiotic [Mesobacillus foraminis]MBT2757893.1 mersacidin/lichenicidin family type 2 lantibiotic [Mesobacillus foraminis]TCN18917.1 mersacidin/lichenicidin family type 2 lantibiotic [Mesobacillus foraminis]
MNEKVIQYWRDPATRSALSAAERNQMPVNPAGDVLAEISDADLDQVVGAADCANVCTWTKDCSICPSWSCWSWSC